MALLAFDPAEGSTGVVDLSSVTDAELVQGSWPLPGGHVVHAWLRVLATIAEYIAQMVSDRGHHVRHFVEDFVEALPAER